MYAPGRQTIAFAMKFQWTAEGLWPWFDDRKVTLKFVHELSIFTIFLITFDWNF